MLRLIIAKPSPFARKVRVGLLEKGISFEAVVDVPWNPDTRAPDHNPLGKIPVLVLEDGSAVYDSRVIVEYLDALAPEPRLIPDEPALRVAHRQVEALADGVCDAVVLIYLERSRAPERRSGDWIDRQRRKVEAGVAEADRLLGSRPDLFDGLGLAGVALGCALAYLDLRLPEFPWRDRHPRLVRFSAVIEERPSFRQTVPEPQVIAPLR